MNRVNNFLIILIFAFAPLITLAQLSNTQVQYIEIADRTDHSFDPRRPQFLKIGANAFTRYNPVSLLFSSSLFLYQKFLSPQLQSHCPYQISCSAFSKASIEEYGIVKGVALSADRLTRCTQFTLIDILPSQINVQDGYIIDSISKYAISNKHGHKHTH